MLSRRKDGRKASLMAMSLGRTRLSLSNGIRNADTRYSIQHTSAAVAAIALLVVARRSW